MLESMGSVAQVRRSIFGSNEDDPSDSANHKSLVQLAALLEFKPKEGGQSNATQAVSVLAGKLSAFRSASPNTDCQAWRMWMPRAD